MHWRLVNRATTAARLIADRHYSRQKPGTAQFVPPGRCIVLLTEAEDAYWVTSWPYAEYVKHAWPGAWVCSAFRNEGPTLSSELIREAVAATRWVWSEVPALGMVTFVDTAQVRRKRDWGRCYRRAGWTALQQRTVGGLVVLQLLPLEMPAAEMPWGVQERMWKGES